MPDPETAELAALFEAAVACFGERVRQVPAGQWDDPTPDADWDVRALVNHLVYEDLWAAPLLAGRTVGEVGDSFDGDLLGDDPRAAFDGAAAAAVAAVRAMAGEGALERTVHVSFGDIPAAEYVSQLLSDHVIHAWDLARALGGDDALDPELVEWVLAYIRPNADGARAAGVFGPEVQVPDCSDPQTRLLAVTGRRR
jgi:uncharacterized protein (TIGR03086 family)